MGSINMGNNVGGEKEKKNLKQTNAIYSSSKSFKKCVNNLCMLWQKSAHEDFPYQFFTYIHFIGVQ